MQRHNLKRQHRNKKSRQIGRGGTRGKTSGRGTKGQNARAGHKKRPEIRDFIKRIPKLRGRGKNINTSIQTKPFVISVSALDKLFKTGDVVSPQSLSKAGALKSIGGKLLRVKILGNGLVKNKLTIEGCLISVSARKALEDAGGVVK